MNQLKYAQEWTICICKDAFKKYKGKDFIEFFNVLSTLKWRNQILKTN